MVYLLIPNKFSNVFKAIAMSSFTNDRFWVVCVTLLRKLDNFTFKKTKSSVDLIILLNTFQACITINVISKKGKHQRIDCNTVAVVYILEYVNVIMRLEHKYCSCNGHTR